MLISSAISGTSFPAPSGKLSRSSNLRLHSSDLLLTREFVLERVRNLGIPFLSHKLSLLKSYKTLLVKPLLESCCLLRVPIPFKQSSRKFEAVNTRKPVADTFEFQRVSPCRLILEFCCSYPGSLYDYPDKRCRSPENTGRKPLKTLR